MTANSLSTKNTIENKKKSEQVNEGGSTQKDKSANRRGIKKGNQPA